MKNILLTLLFLSISSLNGFSQSNWSLKGGLTSSYFTNAENSSPGLGLVLGVSRKFSLKENFSINGGINFATRGAILKNRSIAPYTDGVIKLDAYSWDIHLKLGFIEIPVLFQYSVPLNNKTNLIFFTGTSFSIPILDFTKLEKKEYIEEYDPNNPSGREYDYYFGDGEKTFTLVSNTPKFIFNFGCKISYSDYFIELRYILDTSGVYRIDNISGVHHKMNSIYILFGKML